MYSVLSQYRFCVAGVGLGAAYGIKFPHGKYGKFSPFLVGGITGTMADMLYAYNVTCIEELQRYRNRSK